MTQPIYPVEQTTTTTGAQRASAAQAMTTYCGTQVQSNGRMDGCEILWWHSATTSPNGDQSLHAPRRMNHHCGRDCPTRWGLRQAARAFRLCRWNGSRFLAQRLPCLRPRNGHRTCEPPTMRVCACHMHDRHERVHAHHTHRKVNLNQLIPAADACIGIYSS